MNHPLLAELSMHFPRRLAQIRKERGLTQKQIADQADVHVSQYTCYKAGSSQPSIEAFQRIVLAPNVSADALLFNDSERGSKDERLRLQFEAVGKLDAKKREATQTLIDRVMLTHDAKRYAHRVSG